RENQRRDDRLDQIDENIAEKIHFVSPVGPKPSDESADDKADHDLGRERWAIPQSMACRSCAHFSFCVSCRQQLWQLCMFLTHLECTACGLRHEWKRLQNLCTKCRKPLFAVYDLESDRELECKMHSG